ncbi:MAG: Glycosyl transferase family 4 [Candidatus Woesebacteria bacterium GW2011_GWA2_44_33]|uniref:Glycosyl transferase family 4 n=1 Tax=Candidatus Woesebacteria bacterium GW2011_GWA2_44_33 TaxID=1618564 RepID=A0A0G1J2F4_9BACT|nr:MAG: Glycosyl transferase family 4 [Candidatus Woesebacteria bacterium GW2011_GWA2_44_33]
MVDREPGAARDSPTVFPAVGGRAIGREAGIVAAGGGAGRGGSFGFDFGSEDGGRAKNGGQNNCVDGSFNRSVGVFGSVECVVAGGSMIAFLLPALVSFLVTPAVIWGYKRMGALGRAKRREMDTHEKQVPRGGGIPIYLGILIGAVAFLPLDQHLIGILVGGLVGLAVGVADDWLDLNPYFRLGLLFLAAGAVVAAGVGIAYINLPFLGIVNLDQPRINFWFLGEQRSIWVLSDLFALVFIVAVMNFVNWSKGLDGQLPGIVVIAAVTIGVLSLKFSGDVTQWPVLILALILAGAYAGFLPWNFYPQKIMPGYAGGILGGYFLAVLAILSTTKVGTLLVVLGVPVVDAGIIMGRRILAGKSPVWGDRGHWHHYLLDKAGWSKRKIALFYWGVTGFLGMVALKLNSRQKLYTILGVVLVIGGSYWWYQHFGRFSKRLGRSGG